MSRGLGVVSVLSLSSASLLSWRRRQ